MPVQTLNFLVSSLLITVASASDLPIWITKGPVSDSSFHYVVCSHDGIDPEEARQIAESKCLASAAKIGGVSVKVTQKTVQSLTGSDSSEVAEIQPLEARIKCEWTDRYLEKVQDGFRIWLRCKVLRSSITSGMPKPETRDIGERASSRHAEATLVLTTVPRADRVVIIGVGGERVIEPSSNVVSLVVSNGDNSVEISKLGYKKATVSLPTEISHGSKISREIVLERD